MRPFYRRKGKRPMASVQPGNQMAPSGGQYILVLLEVLFQAFVERCYDQSGRNI